MVQETRRLGAAAPESRADFEFFCDHGARCGIDDDPVRFRGHEAREILEKLVPTFLVQ
jgi:hypothetical protein